MLDPSCTIAPNARRNGGALTALRVTVAILAVLFGPAATCANQDYLVTEPLVLENAAPMAPIAVAIEQPYRGLNSIDYEVTNTGSEAATYSIYAAVTCALESCTEKATSRVIGPIEPGASEYGRLYESELGLGELMHIEFQCFAEEPAAASPCSGVLEFVLILRQVDCRSNQDCPSDEFCDQNLGYCRISGEEGKGCSAAPEAVELIGVCGFLAALLLLGMAGRRFAGGCR